MTLLYSPWPEQVGTIQDDDGKEVKLIRPSVDGSSRGCLGWIGRSNGVKAAQLAFLNAFLEVPEY
jgi:hypothetical protein